MVVLLENPTAQIARLTLKRIAERQGANDRVRSLLLERTDLPAAVRQLLVQFVAEALSGSAFVRAAIGARRIERVTREAGHAATIAILGHVTADELPVLVEHLRTECRLTPAFLMQALCLGRTDFFASAIRLLSGVEERRVRSILATARHHAVRALIESAGLSREVSPVFVEAILLWRNAVQSMGDDSENIAAQLMERLQGRAAHSSSAAELIEMVDKLALAEERRHARDYATGLALVA